MTTLLIFSALIYLSHHVGFKPDVQRILDIILAIAGIALWVLGCFGVAILPWFRT